MIPILPTKRHTQLSNHTHISPPIWSTAPHNTCDSPPTQPIFVEGTMFGSVATTAMSPKNFLDHLLTLFQSSLATSTPLRWSFYILQQICAYLQSGI